MYVGAFLAAGIFGHYLYVNPRGKLVIVVLSTRPKPIFGVGTGVILRSLSSVLAALRWLRPLRFSCERQYGPAPDCCARRNPLYVGRERSRVAAEHELQQCGQHH